jgi:hypothetical protein
MTRSKISEREACRPGAAGDWVHSRRMSRPRCKPETAAGAEEPRSRTRPDRPVHRQDLSDQRTWRTPASPRVASPARGQCCVTPSPAANKPFRQQSAHGGRAAVHDRAWQQHEQLIGADSSPDHWRGGACRASLVFLCPPWSVYEQARSCRYSLLRRRILPACRCRHRPSRRGLRDLLPGQLAGRRFALIQACTSLSSHSRTRACRTVGWGKLGRRDSWSARVRDTPSMAATSLIPTSAMAIEP